MTEELKALKAGSMLAPVVPARESSVSGRGTPSIASVGVPGTSRRTGSVFGTGVGNPVVGYGGGYIPGGFDPDNRNSWGLSKEGRKPDKVAHW